MDLTFSKIPHSLNKYNLNYKFNSATILVHVILGPTNYLASTYT